MAAFGRDGAELQRIETGAVVAITPEGGLVRADPTAGDTEHIGQLDVDQTVERAFTRTPVRRRRPGGAVGGPPRRAEPGRRVGRGAHEARRGRGPRDAGTPLDALDDGAVDPEAAIEIPGRGFVAFIEQG